MSKAMIVLEATRVEWGACVVTPGGGVRQEVRLHEGDECKVVLVINAPADSELARDVIENLRHGQGVHISVSGIEGQGVNAGSIRSDVAPAT